MNTVYTSDVHVAAEALKSGGLCAVPTETVYGLAGNGLDENAVAEVYAVKGRPENKALSLMVPDASGLQRCGEEVPPAACVLAERFWPGPLTLVVRAKADIPASVLAGGNTVGLRCPDHPLTLELLRELDFPLAAPSANPSGESSAKTASQVRGYFDGKIACVLDGGECGLGRESTILDLSETPYRVLRQGALSESEIFDALREKMTVVGLTGGTGCGKTTALRAIAEKGGRVIDCDAVYHGLLENSEALRAELRAAFPEAFDGDVFNRKKLGSIVFVDAEKLELLNTITHRHIRLAVDEALTDCVKNGIFLAAVDAIALIESGLGGICNAVIGVTAPTEARVGRLMKREGISREYALLRISAQKGEDYFRENCDYILENDGSEAAFVKKCRALVRIILNEQEGEHHHE